MRRLYKSEKLHVGKLYLVYNPEVQESSDKLLYLAVVEILTDNIYEWDSVKFNEYNAVTINNNIFMIGERKEHPDNPVFSLPNDIFFELTDYEEKLILGEFI